MPSPFARMMAAADAVQTRTFGEALLVSPMAGRRDGPKSPDPDRDPVTVRGVFTLRPGDDTLQGVRRGTEIQGMARLSMAPAQVWFEARVLAGLPYALKVDDRITLAEQLGTPVYAIVKRGPTDLDDAVFPLVRVIP